MSLNNEKINYIIDLLRGTEIVRNNGTIPIELLSYKIKGNDENLMDFINKLDLVRIDMNLYEEFFDYENNNFLLTFGLDHKFNTNYYSEIQLVVEFLIENINIIKETKSYIIFEVNSNSDEDSKTIEYVFKLGKKRKRRK